jgi:hypothetical protein
MIEQEEDTRLYKNKGTHCQVKEVVRTALLGASGRHIFTFVCGIFGNFALHSGSL